MTFVIIVGGFQKALHYVFAIKIPTISYTEARIDLYYDLRDLPVYPSERLGRAGVIQAGDGLFGGPAPRPNGFIRAGGDDLCGGTLFFLR